MLDLNFKQYSNIIENNADKKLISIHNWLFETVNNESQGSCPTCGKDLVLRINKANQNQFLGCKGYPNCRYTTGYNPNKAKNVIAPQQNQPQTAGQVQQKQWWFYAEVITDSDPRFKIKEKVALRKFDNYKWQYITLINGNAGYVDNDDLQNVFKSILKNGTKLKTPDNPSLKDLINQDPDLAVEFQTTTASDKAKGMIKDSMMSEEQKAIEQKFENIINGKSKNHIMINALAGTGKTTMLRHLAWKYGSSSQSWLYIVFNNKNKVEATEKFPSFVTVRTTNGFLGEVLSNKNNSTAIKKTHRIVNLENDDVKKLQKIRVIADSPVFEEIMEKYKLPSKIPNNLGIDNEYQLNAFRSFLNIVKFSYKEQVVKLASLLKSNALDPRKSENLISKATEIFDDYDFDENFSKAQEKLEGWSRNERFFEEMNQIIKNNFGFEFGSINYKLEIIHGAIWILEESMPGFTKAKYKSKDKNHDLSDYRDFDDDLWYTAIHSNEINWPKFDVVLADEIQDFNENQKIMLQKMASQGSIVVAVGDPNQSLYRFRGADANSFSNISSMLKNVSGNGEDIEQTLTKNFRSKKYIIDFANEETHVKNLKSGLTDSEESANGKISKFEKDYQDAFRELINEKEANGHVKETAFIARTNDPLIHAALTLLSNNIPFIIIGKDIANDIKKELQNIIYHFKLNDDSEVSSLKNMIMKYVEGYNEKYSGSAARKDFLKELEEVTNAMLATISQFEESQEQKTIGKYKKWINVKLGGFDIEENEKDYAEYKKRMEKEKPIVLITAHRSKGLEFERVFILRYDHFPHPTAKREKDKAQEANAKYVAITRAKEELHIIKLKGQPGYKPPKDEDF